MLLSLSANGQTAYSKLFWIGYNPSDLESTNLDGSGHTVLRSSSNAAFALEVDVPNNKVYWCDLNLDAIMRSDLNGANAVVFLSNVIDAQGMSIDFVNQRLFWSSTSTLSIESIKLDGTDRKTVVTTAFAGQPEAIKVDVSHQKIYWWDHNSYSMKRSNTDGTSQEVFIAYTGGNVMQIDIDESNSVMYLPIWGPNTIDKINLDGTGRVSLVTGFSTVGWPLALTVDKVNGKIYWWDADMYNIKMANINGTNPVTIRTDVYSVSAMMVPQNRNLVLPLDLLSLTARASSAGVELKWVTAKEVDSKGFAIERSADGVSFAEIGQRPATGGGNYSYLDRTAVAGIAYIYRLRMYDNDGKDSYSENVSARLVLSGAASFSVYPNPSSGNLLYIQSPVGAADSGLGFAIFELSGRRVAGGSLSSLSLGGGRFGIPVSKLANGTFVLRISDQKSKVLQVTKFTR